MLAQQNEVRNSTSELRLYQMRLKMESKAISERLWSRFAMVSPSEMDDQDRAVYHAYCERLQTVKRLINQVTSYLATL